MILLDSYSERYYGTQERKTAYNGRRHHRGAG